MLGLYPNRHVDEGRRALKNRGVLARILSTALVGVEAVLVRVEVDVERGLPAFTTVGLPDSAVRESRERVKTSIRNGGYAFPNDRVTVNLAPADLRKEGSAFDLPIALGILTATGIVKARTAPLAVVGELALDGQIQPVRGVLAAALTRRRERVGTLLVPGPHRAGPLLPLPSPLAQESAASRSLWAREPPGQPVGKGGGGGGARGQAPPLPERCPPLHPRPPQPPRSLASAPTEAGGVPHNVG